MTILCSCRRLSWLLLVLVATITTTPVCRGQSNPPANMTLAATLLYEIQVGSSGRYTCVDPGSRCFFNEQDYNKLNYKGQLIQLVDTGNFGEWGTTWAATAPSLDYLNVTDCLLPQGCFVECNAKCNCTIPSSGGSSNSSKSSNQCLQAVSRAPTTSVPTQAPVIKTCPVQQNTGQCKKVILNVPSNNFFDCYNFCNGTFITDCSFGTNTTTCPVVNCSDSTLIVMGCTDADRPNAAPSTTPGGGGGGSPTGKTSSAPVKSTTTLLAAVVVPMMMMTSLFLGFFL